MDSKQIDRIWARAQAGEAEAVGQLFELLEQEDELRIGLLGHLHAQTGRAHRVVLAGPPGAGKSTLAAELARRFRSGGLPVGVVSVDPSASRAGAAQLGDRVRMNELALEEGIFLRSIPACASAVERGLKVGLIADAMDALGYDPILMEAGGLGAEDLPFLEGAHTLILLLLPGATESLEMLKAGYLEAADVVVVNKADREGADELAQLLQGQVDGLEDGDPGWRVPVLTARANRGEGVDAIVSSLEQHVERLRQGSGFESRRRNGIRAQLRELAQGQLVARMWSSPELAAALESAVEEVAERRVDPGEAADRLADRLLDPSGD